MNIKELGQKEITNVSGGFFDPASAVIGAAAIGSLIMINRTQRGGKAISTVVGGVSWLAGGALHYTLQGISAVAGKIGGVEAGAGADAGRRWFWWIGSEYLLGAKTAGKSD